MLPPEWALAFTCFGIALCVALVVATVIAALAIFGRVRN